MKLNLEPACGGSSSSSSGGRSGNGSISSAVTLDVTQQPHVSRLATNGKTQVILQFSVRDDSESPLTEDQVEVRLELDGNPIDVESLLNQSSTELEGNLFFAMVLDASFSMTQHDSPAFEPMKTTARDSYRQVLDLTTTAFTIERGTST